MNNYIELVAKDLYYSEANNGFGIKCEAVSDALKKYDIEFKDLWIEIIKLSESQED